ncbi:aspartate carbamoyltransferase regulatory subunit [Candidatus Woesearchaeota archaeon]|nr:aspartate carbamoyltransferase regulatory subunit [Candidatus Woesearchaeota archaeon]
MKELKISAIENGTVIDHVPAEKAFDVADILDLDGIENIISIATNLKSKKVGKKGIIKIGGKILSKEETDKIAIIVPTATINIIKNYRVISKAKVRLPERIEKIVKCFNPNCITNKENVVTKFMVIKENPLRLRCEYCERVMKRGDIRLI